MPTLAFYQAQIVLGLRDYARRCGFRQVVVGSSGGIDSALTLALAVDALGAENVVAITMPSVYSSAGSVDDSVTLCRNLGVALQHLGRLDEAAETFRAGLAMDPDPRLHFNFGITLLLQGMRTDQQAVAAGFGHRLDHQFVQVFQRVDQRVAGRPVRPGQRGGVEVGGS